MHSTKIDILFPLVYKPKYFLIFSILPSYKIVSYLVAQRGVILSKICLHKFSLCRIEIYLLKIECLFEMFSQIMHVHNIHLLKLQLYDYHNYCSWQQILSPKNLSNCKLRDQIMTTTFALVWKHPDFRCQTSRISNGFMRWQKYPLFSQYLQHTLLISYTLIVS